jgi:hypothetical protein
MLKTLSTLMLAGGLCPPGFSGARPDADSDFKRGDLSAAEAGYVTALAANPKDPAALLGLARIRLFQDRRADAERLATEVPAGEPNAAAAGRVLAEVKRREAALDPANVDVPASGTKVPFVVTDPLPIVKVRVNDKADAYFLIDTGAAEAALDPDFASELGITVEEGGTGVFAGGKTARFKRAVLDSLSLGDAKVRHLAVTLFPTRAFRLDGTHRLDGIIGTGVLYRFLATLDYPHGLLFLRPRGDSADCERAAANAHDAVAPMWLVGDHFIFAHARVNDGPEGLFNIDTGGAGVGVMVSPATLADSHVTLDTAHASEGQGGGGPVKLVPFTAKVRFASIERADVPGTYTPEGNQYGIFPFDAAGTLSHLFFRPYALTFDFVAMKLVVHQP